MHDASFIRALPFCLLLSAGMIGSGCRTAPVESADLILLGGNIETMDSSNPRAQAIAVRAGRIVAVGTNGEVRNRFGAAKRIIELSGKTVVPGMIDAHTHFIGIGARRMQIDASGAVSKEEIAGKVAAQAAQLKPGEWVQGRGWDQNNWQVKDFPTKEILDAAAPQNPVFLGRVDGHAAWVNSRALEIARINKNTPDPAGGKIIRDVRGVPAGTLVDNAFRLVSRHIPSPTKEQKKQAVRLSIQECLAAGLTGVHEAGGTREDIELYEEMMDAGEFDFRICEFVRWPVDEQKLPHTYESLDYYLAKGPQVGLHDRRLTIRGIKMSLDGALGSRGAAFLEPYADDPGNRGVLRLTEAEVYETTLRGLKAGFQTAVHAIGDRANRIALDAMEKALRQARVSDDRLHKTNSHFQLHPVIPPLMIFAQAHAILTASWKPDHKPYLTWRSLKCA